MGGLTTKSSIPLVLDVKETNIDWRELPPPERDIQKMILVHDPLLKEMRILEIYHTKYDKWKGNKKIRDQYLLNHLHKESIG